MTAQHSRRPGLITRLARSAALACSLLVTGATSGLAADKDRLRAEAFEAAQWALSTSAGAAVAQMSARFASGSDELATLVRQRQDLVDRYRGLDRKLVEAIARAGAGKTSAEASAAAAALRAEQAAAGKAIEAVDAELARRFPAYAELADPKPLTLAETQAELLDGEALVMILPTAEETFVFGLSRGKAVWARAAITEPELAATVRALRVSIDPVLSGARAGTAIEDDTAAPGAAAPLPPVQAGFDRQRAHGIWKALFQPVGAAFADARELLIVTSGPLTSLPISVLPTAAPKGADNDPEALRATEWVARRFATTTLPSVGSLKALRRFRVADLGSEKFRGFGAPKLEGRTGAATAVASSQAFLRGGSGGLADVNELRKLAPLPNTGAELKRLAGALGAGDDAVILAERATETNVKSADLSRTRVVAFATHGLVVGELKGLAEPALVFTPPGKPTADDDGLLTASEAARLRLAAEWVLLSACNTAAGDGTPGAEGLSGLARAFIYAGARALLASHWPVRDDAAARITTRTFAIRAANGSVGRAEALRRAMVELIDDRSDPTLAEPRAWAPFVIVGDGR
ncbi:MAG: CHAT domain-containing protein [Hyphomicrobiaceae bacterium]|nr:CHAT domain-containing protein [Hyphomicrobiaceae bacterium]